MLETDLNDLVQKIADQIFSMCREDLPISGFTVKILKMINNQVYNITVNMEPRYEVKKC